MGERGQRFDDVTRLIGGPISRRKALKLALGMAAGGAAGTATLAALWPQAAGAQCNPECPPPQQCCTTNVAPNVPFCAPAGYTCCGNQACPPPGTQCCPGLPGLPPGPFCAPAGTICCGRFACASGGLAQCCLTGSEPHCEPFNFICCGNVSCPPGFECQGYPAPATCVPI